MKKELIVVLLWLLGVATTSSAQVNLQSGAAEISIPLYSYSDPNNRLNAGISLMYTNGNGLKTSEIASNVGTGWALNFGGSIQRIQNGVADDQKNNDTYNYPNYITNLQEEINFRNWANNYYPNGYLYSEFSPSDPIRDVAARNPLFEPSCYVYKPPKKYQADLEQDVFMFSFGGKTGCFVISKPDQNGNCIIKTLNDSRLIIEKIDGDLNNTINVLTTISEFKITDEDGTVYLFKDADLSEICRYDNTYYYDQYGNPDANPNFYTICPQPTNVFPLNAGPINGLGATKGKAQNKFLKNKWFLTEISNPLTGKKILFEYETYNFDVEGEKTCQATNTTFGNDPYSVKSKLDLTILREKGVGKRIKRIIFSANEKAEFIYSTDSRIDLPSDKSLSQIDISYDNQIRYSWLFNYGYFVKNEIKEPNYSFSIEERKWSRLCLTKLTKKGLNDRTEPPYTFSYYMGNEDNLASVIPPMHTFQHDSWGYYNATILGFYNPNDHTMSTANPPYEPYNGKLLSKDIYFNLTAYSYLYDIPTLEARNGVLKSMRYPTGGSLNFEFEQNRSNTNSLTGGIRVSRTIEKDDISSSNDIVKEYKYVKEDQSSSGWEVEPWIHMYVDSGFAANSSARNAGVNYLDIAINLQKELNISKKERAERAKQIAAMKASDLRAANSQALKSCLSGTLESALLSYFLVLYSEPNLGFINQNFNSIPYNAHNPRPFQYSRVEVINKLSATNIGRTVYEFTSPTDYPLIDQSLAVPFSSKQRYCYWEYGQIKAVTVFDQNNVPVQRTENNYNSTKYTLQDPRFISQKWFASRRWYAPGFVDASPTFPYLSWHENVIPMTTSTNNIKYQIYSPVCGRLELTQTKEYVYRNLNEFSVVTTDFEYSSLNYQVKKIKTTNSKGELIENVSYYPDDYTVTGAIQEMKSKNLVNIPISTQTLITKAGNQKYLVGGTVSEFSALSNNDIKPVKTYSFRSDEPINESQVTFNPAGLIPNANYYKDAGSIIYYKVVGSTIYHSSGLPIEIVSDAGKSSTIYDYNNELAVATVVNASIENVAYTSFEADGTGGWTIGAGSTIVNQGGITGGKSCSGTVTKTTPLGNYTITAWAKDNGNITVNGITGILLRTIGVWKLYEWSLNNIASIIVVGDNFDELRLYPKGAQITTQTFDPLIGKTSSCDANNRITYYEYDFLNRLKFIRDEERNIIKMYEYNYKF